jgi:Trk-type K+ transport system membrane component
MFSDNLASFRKGSAFGTARFSLGITRWLHPSAKGIIIVSVFVGRVGLLTPVMPVGREGKAAIYALLEEDVMVE